jgi:hypothetical protein
MFGASVLLKFLNSYPLKIANISKNGISAGYYAGVQFISMTHMLPNKFNMLPNKFILYILSIKSLGDTKIDILK